MNVNPLGLIPLLDERVERLRSDKPSIIILSFAIGVLVGGGIAAFLVYLQRIGQ